MKQCSWKDYLGDIIPFVSSPDKEFKRPPDSMILHYLRRAAEDFLCEAGLMRADAYLDMQCGVQDYPIMDCEGDQIRITRVWIRTDDCGDYMQLEEGWSWDDDNIYMSGFVPDCDVVHGIKYEYTYAPDLSACEMPSMLCDKRWRQALVDGTLYYLYHMAHMDWSDGGLYLKKEKARERWFIKGRNFASRQRNNKRRVSEKAHDVFWGGRY